tara:strand:+ start:31413 stop:31757 length:345 start_codon:yes stop_codon:yes gene_type:complete
MATSYDLNITQGSEFYVRLNAKDDSGNAINLNNYGLSGVVKHRYSDSSVLFDLKPSGVTDFLTSGYIDILIRGADTKTLPIIQGVYDIELYSGTYVDKLVQGNFNVYPEASSTN